MSLSATARRSEMYQDLCIQTVMEAEALVRETKVPETLSSGMFRTEEVQQYAKAYEYSNGLKIDIQNREADSLSVKNVKFVTSHGDLFNMSSTAGTPDGVLYGQTSEELRALPDAFAEAWELNGHERDLDDFKQSIEDFIDECQSAELPLDTVVEAIDETEEGLLQRIFDTDNIRTLPELNTAVQRADNSDIRKHYQDDMLVVVSFSASRHRDNSAAFVIGKDDSPAGVFIHQVDNTNISWRTETTKEATRKAMGFDVDADIDTLEQLFEPRRRVRVQGDLRMTLLRTFEDATTAGAACATATEIRERVEKTYGERAADEFLESTRLYFESNRILANIYWSYATTATELFRGEFPPLSDVGEARTNRIIGETLTGLCEDILNSDTPSVFSLESDRLNLPIDNHLLRFENAATYPLSTTGREPCTVVVPESSTVNITHHEHPEKRLSLEPGLYEVSLLPRGPVPDGITPPRW